MFKNVIAPVQAWLLSRGQCVGCSLPLKQGYWEKRPNGTAKVTCKCGRIFIYTENTQKYRRALFAEV